MIKQNNDPVNYLCSLLSTLSNKEVITHYTSQALEQNLTLPQLLAKLSFDQADAMQEEYERRYKVAPRIDWSKFPDSARYISKDKNGNTYLSVDEPIINHSKGVWDRSGFIIAISDKLLDNVPWERSLMKKS